MFRLQDYSSVIDSTKQAVHTILSEEDQDTGKTRGIAVITLSTIHSRHCDNNSIADLICALMGPYLHTSCHRRRPRHHKLQWRSRPQFVGISGEAMQRSLELP